VGTGLRISAIAWWGGGLGEAVAFCGALAIDGLWLLGGPGQSRYDVLVPRTNCTWQGVKLSQGSGLDRHEEDHFLSSAVQFSTIVIGAGADVAASAVTLLIRNLFPSAVTS
jgi:hypothetical protein